MDSLGIRICVARRRKHLSQAKLAAALGVSRSAVANWEGAGKTAPGTEHLIGIAAVTGVSCDWLVSGNGQPCTATCDAHLSPVTAQNCTERQMLLAFRGHRPHVRRAVLRLLEAG